MAFRFLTIIALTMLIAACQPAIEVPAVPKPDLSGAYVEVREFLNEKRFAVEAAPTTANAWGEYGMALDAHEYSDEAIQCYDIAAQLKPDQLRWKYLLALKIRHQTPDKAEILLAQITKSPKATLAAMICHADVLSELGRDDDARQLLANADAAFPGQPAVLFRQANLAFQEGKVEFAREKLKSIATDFGETVRLQSRLSAIGKNVQSAPSVSADELPGVDQTIVDHDLAAVLNCRRDPLWEGKRAADRAKAGDQLSLMTLATLVKKHPELIENRIQLAFLLAEHGDRELAEQMIAEGLELTPGDSRLLAGQAVLAMLDAEWTVAEERLGRLLKAFPDHEAGWSDLAFVLEQLSRPVEAIDAYDRAVKLSPADGELIQRRKTVLESIEKGRLP